MPMFCITDESITVVGVGVVKSLVRRMREPVTVTSSSTAGALPPDAEAAGASCECARPPKLIESATATPPVSVFEKREFTELERMAALTAAAIDDRVAIMQAPSHKDECLPQATDAKSPKRLTL